MQMIEHKLFPTLVGKFEDVLFEDQCDQLISSIDTSKLKQYHVINGDADTSFNKQFDIFTEFPELLSISLHIKLQTCLQEYVSKYRCSPVSISNTWITYQYPHSKLTRHSHPGSTVSGVLYLKTDEKSSPIYFYNPNTFPEFTSRLIPYSDYLNQHVKFTPKTGDLLIFPSWLAHGSDIEENMSEERIILSFNTHSVSLDY